MSISVTFPRQHHYSATPWFQSVLIAANIISCVVDLKAFGFGDPAEVVNKQYATSLSIAEFPLITIIVQA
jgi:hypothetical protein